WSVEDLRNFNQMDRPALLEWFQNISLLNAEQAGRVRLADLEFVDGFEALLLRIPEISKVVGAEELSVRRLARSLFAARLLAEFLEILTPPSLSYEKTGEGTVDLLAELADDFSKITGGAWSVFFPRADFGLLGDAT